VSRLGRALVTLSLMMATAAASAQTTGTPPQAAPQAAPASPQVPVPAEARCGEAYRVGSGDQVEVVVFGNDDLSRTVPVRTDGAIALPLVGDVPVAGASLAEIRERLTSAYARYLVSPQLDVRVREYNSRFVALVGELNQPGRRALGECTRVIDVLLQAGGFRDGASSEVVVSSGEGEDQALRARVDRGVFTPDARRVLETVLRGGEIVTVLPRSFVTVQGEVARPNRYPIEGRLTVTGALSLAGGLTRSGSGKAKIVRVSASGERQVLDADLKAIRDGRAEDLVLQPDDIVTVPRRFF
jgi:polysaccharide export outer membrane protein